VTTLKMNARGAMRPRAYRTSQPSVRQKRWREEVRALGSIISGGPAVIHHAVGRTAKHDRIEIGHWFILPLTELEHRAMHRNQCRKVSEKEWFTVLIQKYVNVYGKPSAVPDDVYKAIREYHR